MILPAMKMIMKTDPNIRMSLDPLECIRLRQHARNLLTDLVALEMILSLLKIFLRMIRKKKHADLKVFTQTNTMEINPKPLGF